jgi:hypothetical protein
MRRWLRVFDARDALALVGLGLLVAGVAQIYAPAAYIVPGVGLIGLALWRIKP